MTVRGSNAERSNSTRDNARRSNSGRISKRRRKPVSDSESEQDGVPVSPSKREHKPSAKVRENMAHVLERLQAKYAGWRWQPKVKVEDIFNDEEKKQLPAALGHLDDSKTPAGLNSDFSESSDDVAAVDESETVSSKDEKTPTYQCGKCDFQSTERDDVVAHIKSTHLKKRSAVSKNKSENIKSSKPSDLKLKCDKCECPNLISRAVFEAHRKHHGAVHRYTCRLCDFCHSGRLHAMYHMKHDHPDILAETLELGPRDRYKGPNIEPNPVQETDQQTSDFKCDRCWYFGKTQVDLDYHVDYSHIDAEDEPSLYYTCVFCNYRASKDGLVKRHMETNHKKKISSSSTFECGDGCEFSVPQNRIHAMITHKARHRASQKSTCSHCSYGSNIGWVVEKHERIHHETNSEPEKLSKLKKRDKKPDQHAKRSDTAESGAPLKPRKSENKAKHVAEKSAAEKSSTKEKLTKGNSTKEKPLAEKSTTEKRKSDDQLDSPFACHVPRCNFTAPNEQGLTSHMRGHEPNRSKRFVCDICKWRSHNRPVLELHFKQSHNGRGFPIIESEEPIKEADGRHYCRQCDYSTKHGVRDLQGHMNRHQSGQNYNCNMCSYGSSRQIDVTKHKERDHHAAREPITLHAPKLKYYKCDRCSFTTYDVFRYYSHHSKH